MTVHGVTAMIRALMLALFLVPFTATAEAVYYPEYKRSPVAPLVVVDQIVKADDPARPACIPANDACDLPDPLTPVDSGLAQAQSWPGADPPAGAPL
jgi:hypothetical protein